MISKEKIADYCRKYSEFLLYVLILIVPLFFTMFLHRNAFVLPKNILFLALITIIGALLLINKLLLQQRFVWPGKIKRPLFAVFIISLLSTIFSKIRTNSFFGDYWVGEGLLTFLGYLALFVISLQIIDNEEKLWKVLQLAYLTGVLMALFGFLEIWYLTPNGYFAVYQEGMISTTGFKNYTAVYLSMTIMLGWGILLKYWKSSYLKILLIASQTTLIFALLFCQGRAGFLGFLAGSAFFGILLFRRFDLRKFGRALIITLLILLVILLIFRPQIKLFDRFKNTPLGKDPRLMLWSCALDISRTNPLLGIGLNNYKYFYPRYAPRHGAQVFYTSDAKGFSIWQRLAHNEFLDILVAQGILGLLAYLWLLIALSRSGYSWLIDESIKDKTLPAILLSALIAYIINVQFGFSNISYTPLFWIIAASILLKENREQPQKYPSSEKWSSLLKIKLAVISFITLFMLILLVRAFQAESHYKQGLYFKRSGQPQKAVAEMKRATELNPHFYFYKNELAGAYRANEQPTMSLTVYEKSLGQNPYNVITIYNIAMVHFKNGRLEQALKYLQKALEIDPYFYKGNYTNFTLSYNYFIRDTKKGDYQAAIAKGIKLLNSISKFSTHMIDLKYYQEKRSYRVEKNNTFFEIHYKGKPLVNIEDPYSMLNNSTLPLSKVLKIGLSKIDGLEISSSEKDEVKKLLDEILYYKDVAPYRYNLLMTLRYIYTELGQTKKAQYCTQLMYYIKKVYPEIK